MGDTLRIDLIRYVLDSETPTLGRLHCPGVAEIHTLEPAWRENEPNVSCIPAGWYELRLGWFKDRYESLEVLNPPPGRSGIELHAGNNIEETEGCIIVGWDRIWTERGPEIKGGTSRPALEALVARVKRAGNRATLVVAYR